MGAGLDPEVSNVFNSLLTNFIQHPLRAISSRTQTTVASGSHSVKPSTKLEENCEENAVLNSLPVLWVGQNGEL